MDKLTRAREQINVIDRKMAELFEKRMHCAEDIASYKIENGLPIFDSSREKAVIERNSEYIENDVIREYYVNFLQDLMDTSKRYQERLLSGLRVAYSGTEGAFAYIASGRIFKNANLISYPNFSAAYSAVECGECDVAVLPLENSYGGEVGQVSDMIFSGSLYINGIYELLITQELVGVPGAKLSNIKKVISHPQALSQCAEHIKKMGWEQIQFENTALAAKYVAEKKDPTLAAIASEESASIHGLQVIESQINDNKTNVTKFGVFSRSLNSSCGTKKDDRFILVFTVKNEAGALAEAMNVIGKMGFNMRAIRSRPMKDLVWQYHFYVECEGAVRSDSGSELLSRLTAFCDKLKLSGVYSSQNTFLAK
ncbi:MAG: chorismate mutase [Ruminococcaceae bacterium]|nr:chorismate mutase [Oscillospiraceae bacterium]